MNRRAFTLMELLVSVAIASALMGFIFFLFDNTQHAISTGIATGNAVVSSETIGDQLEKDADLMRAPNATDGGFLIIINKTLDPVDIADPTQGGRSITRQETIRTDQLIFIANAGKSPFRAMTPKNDNNFHNDITAAHARIFYGHVTPTQANGTDLPAALQTPIIDSKGHHWLLGRQALLIDPDVATFTAGTDTHFDGTVVRHSSGAGTALSRALTDVSSLIYGDAATPSTVVNGLATDPYPTAYLAFTYAGTRLRTNPAPEVGDFESWRIAQTHPSLASNVSDFIVEFAADIDNDGLIDTERNGQSSTGNDIFWYSAATPGTTDPDFAGSAAGYSYDPYVDIANPALASYTLADAAFIFQYGDDGVATPSAWPYMIRIRYRLHDDAGRIRSTGNTAPISGRWFEHIIKVNRP